MESTFDKSLAIRCGEAIDAMYRGVLNPDASRNKTDTQYRVEEPQPGQFVIIFPGTASKRDWLTDLKVFKTSWNDEDAMTHFGFTEAFRSVGEEILEKLRAKNARSVIITGHSLGGALATLCADLCADVGVDVEAVYTFGCPRVGNRSFAKQYNEDLDEITFRIVNARDPVPWFPLPFKFVRTGVYTHVDQLVYLKHEGGMEFTPVLPHIADAFAIVGDRLQEKKLVYDVLSARCHQMKAYLTKLKQLK